MLPNFFIVGAPKAGTDELYYHLDQHPQIYMSPLKEPCFFSMEVRLPNFDDSLQRLFREAEENLREYLEGEELGKRFGGIITNLADYERLFRGVQNELAIGEGSVCYLWSSSAASAIASTIPHARIIIVLMDPAERAFRQYLKSLADRNVTHSFRTHLELALRDSQETLNLHHPFLAFGRYAEQVSRYLAMFPREHIHLSLFEDRETDPKGWFRSVLTFLGVDDRFVPHPVEIPSKPHIARSTLLGAGINQLQLKPAISKWVPSSLKTAAKRLYYRDETGLSCTPEERAVLVQYYRDDILKLQKTLGRDLSRWLEC